MSLETHLNQLIGHSKGLNTVYLKVNKEVALIDLINIFFKISNLTVY